MKLLPRVPNQSRMEFQQTSDSAKKSKHFPLTPFRIIRGVICLLVLLSTALFFLIYFVPVVAVLLRFFSTLYSRKVVALLFGLWLGLWPFLFEKVNETNVIFSGDHIPPRERVLLIANHRTEVDWMYVWNLALRKGCLGHIKYLLKKSLMKLPVFGWGFYVLEFIPLERDWVVDEPVIKQTLSTFTNPQDPLWLTLFPEGTDYSEEKCKRSQEFASQNGLPVLNNLLLPKTKGFYACLEILRSSLDAEAIAVSATQFTLQNNCGYTVWPGTLSGNGIPISGDAGFALTPTATIQLTAPGGWSGRFWARTGCNFTDSGTGSCKTGDCGGTLKCPAGAGGVPPVSLVEFTIAKTKDEKDFYDVSLVDGYNVGIGVRATGGTGDCQYAGCVADLNVNCPKELQVKESGDKVVACKSACAQFNTAEYCCTGEHATPATCSPTMYSKMFKDACPTAYSYAYDDASSTCTCSGADYIITFCPTNS